MNMHKTIEVIYEKGVFKPVGKIDLEEGERLEMIIISRKKKYAGLIELIEELSNKFRDVKEDPLEILLKMRKRTWD